MVAIVPLGGLVLVKAGACLFPLRLGSTEWSASLKHREFLRNHYNTHDFSDKGTLRTIKHQSVMSHAENGNAHQCSALAKLCLGV